MAHLILKPFCPSMGFFRVLDIINNLITFRAGVNYIILDGLDRFNDKISACRLDLGMFLDV